ncbi:MFS transporter [Cupriavidus alkaliphilus]|uniref:MFS transporter n=1 Tax=Cupriavidus alkaliphilus TaxID=942866 RepID=UPI001619E136|nr:MFS transporter [Cupriavidus alkaliphilus]MBB3015703.1 MFS family permease [Cupriavidus alkaliphilus]
MTRMAPSSTTGKTDDLLFRKISWRLLPVLCLCYVFNYLDRTNVGYAQLQMKEHLAFSDAVFGLGASIFFVGYALFEVPSNMLLARIGVRATLLRIMGLWGLASAAMMFVTTPTQFYILRFLVGVFEAGFAPGVLYYLTLWFPRHRLAQATALFFMAFSVAPIVAGPTAGAIMTWLDGAHGLRGWQWLFVLEGIPCVLLGIMAFATLPDRPGQAAWLDDTERDRIAHLLRTDAPASTTHGDGGVRAASRDARVWVLGLVSFLVILGIYALAFWKPTLLKGMGLSIMQVGLVATLPAACGVAASVLVGRHSDRTGERRWHFAIAALVAAAGLMLTTLFPKDPLPAILCLTLVSIGTSSAFTVLWSMPGGILSGPSAAAGIAIISTVGGSAGVVAPAAVGAIKAATGSFTLSLYLLSLALVLAAVILVTWFRPRDAGPVAVAPIEAR